MQYENAITLDIESFEICYEGIHAALTIICNQGRQSSIKAMVQLAESINSSLEQRIHLANDFENAKGNPDKNAAFLQIVNLAFSLKSLDRELEEKLNSCFFRFGESNSKEVRLFRSAIWTLSTSLGQLVKEVEEAIAPEQNQSRGNVISI